MEYNYLNIIIRKLNVKKYSELLTQISDDFFSDIISSLPL